MLLHGYNRGKHLELELYETWQFIDLVELSSVEKSECSNAEGVRKKKQMYKTAFTKNEKRRWINQRILQEILQQLYLLFASSSFAKTHPAASNIVTDTAGATIDPKIGINLDNSFATVFRGCFNIVDLIAETAIPFATFSGILALNTALNAIHIVVMVTISTATPKPGTGTAFPPAAATA